MYVPSIPWWDPAVTDAETGFTLCDTAQLEDGQQAHQEAANSVSRGTDDNAVSPSDEVSHTYTCAMTEHMLLCSDVLCIRKRPEVL